ncbi:MAG: collagen-binding domain-containing protein, partial [Planctomycetota bacterium]
MGRGRLFALTALATLTTLAFATNSEANNPNNPRGLLAATDYSVFVEGDFDDTSTNNSGDSEGAIFAGGNVTLPSGYSVGAGLDGLCSPCSPGPVSPLICPA